MIIENTAARVISIGIGGSAQAKDVDLMPGVNDVSDAVWKVAAKHPAIVGMLKDGVLRVDESKADLAEMTAAEAIKLVAKTFDRALLELWGEMDKRTSVVSAIQDQLKTITPPAGESTGAQS